ncbi:MAG: hypothetical protein RR022_02000 [Angelakisella sp.]
MQQFKLILNRLKNPTVLLSIASQLITVLLLFRVEIDRNLLTGLVTAVCTILSLLGIVSNPDSQNRGYGDDLYYCKGCQEQSHHVRVGNSMVCSQCGCVNGDCPVKG